MTRFIYLTFEGGLLLQEERYSFAIDDFTLERITKPDGTIDVKHLQYAYETLLRMANAKWRKNKMIEILIIALTGIISLTIYIIGCSITAQVIKHIKDNF